MPIHDLTDDHPIPRRVAEALLQQVRDHADAPLDLLALLRIDRAWRLGSSVGCCGGERERLAARVATSAPCTDRGVIRRYLSRLGVAISGWKDGLDTLAGAWEGRSPAPRIQVSAAMPREARHAAPP